MKSGIAFVSAIRLEKRPQEVYDLIGKPEEFDKWIVFYEDNTRQDLALAAGFFPSKTRAVANGWHGQPAIGYSEGTFGKNKTPWYCVNTFPHWDDDKYWEQFREDWGVTPKETKTCKCNWHSLSYSCHSVSSERAVTIAHTLNSFDSGKTQSIRSPKDLKQLYADSLTDKGERDYANCWIKNQ